MKYTLTITETPELGEHMPTPPIERVRVLLDEMNTAQLQQVLAVLYRTPRKPRSDRKKEVQP